MDFLLTAILQGIGFSALGLGIYLSLRIFNIPDITTDGSYTLGGVITAVSLTHHLNPIIALVFALTGGMIAGTLTGLIHTKLKVNALLAGILVMTALFSINLMIMGRSNLPLINVNEISEIIPIADPFLKQLSTMFIFISLLTIFLNWVLRTDFGIAMRATGNSEVMVRAMGVNTSNMKVTGLALANGCTALSGYLITQYQGFADINMGIGIVISGLGSVMIGETLFKPLMKKGILYHLIAVVLGCILFRLILALALSAGLDPNYLKLVTAVIVLLIVAVGNLKTIARS
jgi:putative tryptophan/tyrosine transport system permease protein